jgi:class 3 adenylate cyclase
MSQFSHCGDDLQTDRIVFARQPIISGGTSMPPLSTGHNGDPTAVESDSGDLRRSVLRRNFRPPVMSRVSIQSKLLVMLLITSVLSAAVVGYIGYASGRASLQASVFDRMTEIRQSQTRQLQSKFADLTSSLIVYSRGDAARQAMDAFTAGFNQLQNSTIDPAQQQSIVDYYNTVFATVEDEQTGNTVDIANLLPTSNAEKYLQANYTAPYRDADAALKVDDARDGSQWSAANVRFNDFFREIVSRFGFEDALLIDPQGDVVYTAYKGVDLGSNILTGPYHGGALTDAYNKAMQANDVDYVGVTDFGDYQPADEPTAWMVSPVGYPGRVSGVMALQFPISKINSLMTMDRRWEESGMGKTGETFIVGPDDLMRSDSRMFIEDPQRFVNDVVQAGTPPDVAQDSLRQKTTVLVQPVGSPATRLAQQGQRGTLVADDYLGRETLQAYGPVDIPGLHWTVIAKIDTSEAFAPVSTFTRKLVLSTAVIIFVVCLAAMLLARLFVRPIRRLEAGAQRISAGNYDINLPVLSRDEFGELTTSFNDMSRNLAIKDELLAEQRRENDRLLRSLMPETVVARYREGEQIIAQDHQNVTVIFADIVGLDEMSTELDSERMLEIVNGLVRQFDAAAENLGVEQVRTLHNGYLASCGLSVPRLDNVRRTIDFAVEMQRIIERFNAESGNDLKLRAGIDTGAVSSGLVGRTSIAYDLWGQAVSLAYQVSGVPQPGIYVTSQVYEVMRDSRTFVPAGEVTVDGTAQAIWRLSDQAS